MVTYFNKKDLVSFGNYLGSDERRKLYEDHPENERLEPVEDRLKEVSHADFENWMRSLKK